MQLVVTQKGQGDVFSFATVKGLPLQAVGKKLKALKIGFFKVDVLIVANLFKNCFHGRLATINNRVAACFESLPNYAGVYLYRSLLRRELASLTSEGIAETYTVSGTVACKEYNIVQLIGG